MGNLEIIKSNLMLAIKWKDKACITTALSQYRKEGISYEPIEYLMDRANAILKGKTVEEVRQCRIEAETGNEVCELCSA